MNREFRAAPLGLSSFFLVVLTGCALAQTAEPAPAKPAHAIEIASQGATLAMLARPSPEVSELAGDHYRVMFEGPSTVTLVLLDDLDHPHARVRLRALDHVRATSAWVVDFEDLDVGITGRIEMWTLANRLHGDAKIGERSASWRVRLDGDRLAAERWRIDSEGDPRTTVALRNARAIGSDLTHLAEQVDASLTDENRCQIAETIANVELALDLALRAYEGRGRSELPLWIADGITEGC